MSLLTGQTAVVTGGAQGLGYAIAAKFIGAGARVVLGDLDLPATEAAAKELGGSDVALAVRSDVTDAGDVEALVATAVERFGGLDIMVNNEVIDALAVIVHETKTYSLGRKIVDKMAEVIPRQMFPVPVQAVIGAKIIARATVKAYRKDVLAKCYGGDISRKRKLLEK